MAGNGPAPAPQRRRQNKDTYADVQATVTPDAKLRGPDLGGTWSPNTVAWYETWRRSPQAALFLATDWGRLQMMAPLVESYFGWPNDKKLAEIRQNESLLGATHVDRLRARIKVELEPAETVTPPGVTALDEYRARLTG